MKRLLLTGARGFLGRACIAPALAAGYEIHAVHGRGAALAIEDPRLSWRKADLLAPGAAERLLAEVAPTHILHFAWETTHGAYWTSPRNLDWLALGARLFRDFAARGGKRFVSAGSCAEYDWTRGAPLSEDESLERPATFYGRMKLLHHRALMASAEQMGFSAATGRVFFSFGPFENPSRVIAHACKSLAEGRPAKFSSGRQRFDYLHARDIGAGFVALLNSDLSGACNIAAGGAEPLAEIIAKIGAIAGRAELIEMGALPDRAGDPPALIGDNRRILATGWRPSISLDEGLAETYRWWQSKTIC